MNPPARTSGWSHLAPNRRLNRAKELLLDSGLPVKTIAYQCGFTDANYFSRLFRKETGVTARTFRQRAHGRASDGE
jgi:transcriptional regulator GlxA family with amidase domain